jgi:hypothetical protein
MSSARNRLVVLVIWAGFAFPVARANAQLPHGRTPDGPPDVASPRVLEVEAARPARRSALNVALYTVGGAIVGSWAGYVASQITWSDWRDDPGRGNHRRRFALGGAGLGLVGGFLIGHRAERLPGPVAVPEPPIGTQPAITEQEIRASSARSLRQLLRELRPQWLRSRGVDVLQPSRDAAKAPGVRVYLNGELLGGLETLDEVSIDAVTGIQFFDATAAVLRWGAGNDDGAILLTTSAEQ